MTEHSRVRLREPLSKGRVALNIEIAHVAWDDKVAAKRSAEESLLIAQELINERGLQREQISMSVLVDDKENEVVEAATWLRSAAQTWPGIFAAVDWVCFESDLVVLAPQFTQLLVQSSRDRRAREFERYRRRHDEIACSHDVAIWHAFRLGLLGDEGPVLWSPNADRVTPAGFFALEVVSVLEERDRIPEERAREILNELNFDTATPLVRTLFYAV